MTEIDHEKLNRLSRARKPDRSLQPAITGAAVPGERERDLARLQELKQRRHPIKRSTPSHEREKARHNRLKTGRRST
ncbi:protein of unknown function [Bradyrhizobium sp. ORS 285]|nr:protein of unknown function [Bradyrhizobium sp. ORS 285]